MINTPADLRKATKAVFGNTGVIVGSPTYSQISNFITIVHALNDTVNALSSDRDLYGSIHRRGSITTRPQDRRAFDIALHHLTSVQTQYAELRDWIKGIESENAEEAFKNLKEIYADAIQHITTSRYQATNPSASSGINRRLGHSGSFSSPAPGRK